MKEYKSEYTINKLYTNTYAITDNGIGQVKVYMYLLVGRDKALLIDSGYGLLDLKAVTGSVTDKPVVCVCTHGHVDHALGACQCKEAYLHSDDFHVYSRHSSPEFIRGMGSGGLLIKPPKSMTGNPGYQALVEQMAQKTYPPLRALDDVTQFDLGGRTVSWRRVPGHTQGSVAIIDEDEKTVFDADACAMGAWLFLPESSPLSEYLAVLSEYLVFLEKHGITRRYVGHSGKPLGVKDLRKLIKCGETAISKPKGGIKLNSPLGDARIVFAGGSILFCGRKA
jgi:glyoxylase-like metal-dependent hydrolase (beta-lactamase superfamily II)